MSRQQLVDPSNISADIHNRHEIYDNMMAGLSTGRYKLANLEVPAQEKKDKELAKLLYYQLNTNTESEKNISRDEEMARTLDNDLNQTHDLSRDQELARLMDLELNFSAATSAKEDVWDFPLLEEIPDLSRDWEFAKSLDKQLNISIDTSEAYVLENEI